MKRRPVAPQARYLLVALFLSACASSPGPAGDPETEMQVPEPYSRAIHTILRDCLKVKSHDRAFEKPSGIETYAENPFTYELTKEGTATNVKLTAPWKPKAVRCAEKAITGLKLDWRDNEHGVQNGHVTFDFGDEEKLKWWFVTGGRIYYVGALVTGPQ